MQADTPARLHHDAPAWLSSRKYPHLAILQFWLFCLRPHSMRQANGMPSLQGWEKRVVRWGSGVVHVRHVRPLSHYER
jgi:hypothetical protein